MKRSTILEGVDHDRRQPRAQPGRALAEEFLDRKRRGEQPTLAEYVERYPELADEIRDLFPALLLMEDLGAAPAAPPARWPGPRFPGWEAGSSGWATTASSARSAAAAWAWSTRPSRSRWAAAWR